MADKEVEETAKAGADGQDPVQETILETQEKDGDGDMEAEAAIRIFVRDRLSDFVEEINQAVDTLEAWAVSQDDDTKGQLNDRGYFDMVGGAFEKELMALAGGHTPLMDGMLEVVHDSMAFAQESEHDIGNFFNEGMRRSVRDASWFVRDAHTSMLSNEWPQLLELAANGSDQFIQALYQLGLPNRSFKPQDFAQKLVGHSEAYKKSLGPKQKEAVEDVKTAKDPTKAEEIEEQSKEELAQEDTKKAAAM